MPLEAIHGKISHIQHGTEQVSTGRQDSTATVHSWAFRVNGRPVILKRGDHASFADGDEVVAIGEAKNGSLLVLASRNKTSGATYKAPSTTYYILGAVCVVLGIPLSFIGIGIPLVGLGLFIFWKAYILSKANKMLVASTA